MDLMPGQIGDLIARVRARWRWLIALRAGVWAALGASAVLVVALLIARWADRSTVALAVTGVTAGLLAAGVVLRAMWPARRVPTDTQVARFIEEHEPSLDDRLVSAVHLSRSESAPALAAAMLADAARRAELVEPSSIVPSESLRRASMQIAAAVLLVCAVGYLGRSTARRSFDALAMLAFPTSVRLEVTPGDARVQVGTTLAIEARLAGSTAPASAELQRADGEAWVATAMAGDESGAFRVRLDALAESFTYRVVVGNVTSPIYEVSVVRPPRVTRVDVEYRYPAVLGLPARTEEDAGDIYAPAGTDVRLRVHTDRPAASGQMALGAGTSVPLTTASGGVLEAALRIERDDSYRLRLVDQDGIGNAGDTEYFIRMLDDRPPEVRVLRPARDRAVTPLEEVEIEAEAQDDFGVERLDLVYSVRGSAERTATLSAAGKETAVSGAVTLYLEDLDVKPGDFISYYVRARDTPRGRRSRETRSDLFFLEVKPFEQEFSLAQSQAPGGASGSPQLDDLVNAQKEVIVATWKLDRRAEANGAKSAQDIKAVARAEAELKLRVEQTASTFRDATMRDPRRRRTTPGAPRAGQTLPEEDAMAAAGRAMERAVTALQGLKTKDALPPELEALNRLLEAQAGIKERQVSQQVGSGAGQNRQSQDMSTLFDKELAKQQQTNYESPKGGEGQNQDQQSELDKIRELAQRQDELVQRQRKLTERKETLSTEELKRALETLSREQSELRQQVENLARQMSGSSSRGQRQSNQQSGGSGQQSQPSGERPSGQPSQGGQQSPGGQQSQGGDRAASLRDAGEEMREAASELRRDDPGAAGERATRALDKLRDLARRVQADTPNERRRALGDLQLEARQLADAQRELAGDLARAPKSEAGRDTIRRMAGEQERLADRVNRLRQNLDRQGRAASAPRASSQGSIGGDTTRAAAEAAKDIEQQRLGERMQRSAEALRAAAESAPRPPQGVTGEQEAIARALDKLADRLGFSNAPQDEESRKLVDQLARSRELREQMDALSRQIEALGGSGSQEGSGRQPAGSQGGGQAETSPSSGPGEPGGELSRLKDDYTRQLREAKELLDELRRDQRASGQSAGGFTFEGQGMVTSAPGTEAFKQDFAKWEELRRQATQALALVESDLSKRLEAKTSKDRLAAGLDDRAPAEYSRQVDRYFKAIAGRKSK